MLLPAWFENSMGRTHLVITACIYGLFYVSTASLLHKNNDFPGYGKWALLSVTGPLFGGLARSQSFCIAQSRTLLTYLLPVLLLAIAAQLIKSPLRAQYTIARISIWTVAWLAWFAGGLISILHAFS